MRITPFLGVFCLVLIFAPKLQAQDIIPLNKYGKEIKKMEEAYYYKKSFSVEQQQETYHIYGRDYKFTALWIYFKDETGNTTSLLKTNYDSLGNKIRISKQDFTKNYTEIQYLADEKAVRYYITNALGILIEGWIIDGEKTTQVDRVLEKPSFMNQEYFSDFLKKELQYPLYSRRYGESGTILTALHISKEGKLKKIEIVNKETSYDRLVKEAKRFFGKYDGAFLPAQDLQGKPVDGYFIFPLRFVLN
ncbi:energy transducer TonB [Echinicola soli]|nr:energy transducer TonB [Echinicola soli]